MAKPIGAAAMVAALKREGVKVSGVRSWRRHNRRGHGPWGPVHGVMIHHTVTTGAEQTVGLLYRGRSDLPGPLCHGAITKDGTVHLVGHGRVNHAGTGDAGVLEAVIREVKLPAPGADTVDGNARFYGFECENRGDGKDPWPAAQLDAIERVSAALCRHHGWQAPSVIGHLEWTATKSDPRGFSMDAMRERIAERLKHPPDDQPRRKPRPKRPKPRQTPPPAPKPKPTPPRKGDDPMTEAARRTVRTMVQTALSLAAALPILVEAADIPQTAAGVGTALAVAGAVTRVMQSKQVQRLLPKWLRTTVPDPEDIPRPEADRAQGGGVV
ncbi:N-acetylmuramoyl-L-alanine amidase [Streptomyces sp. Da 82-17]|uniref:peptidoglycan recognition protein family protein n=1 Tax=Streptomyces sp. Da 82-17 TaxID=3377116 RepID=UPI0038D39411